jgi:hypothetical protein
MKKWYYISGVTVAIVIALVVVALTQSTSQVTLAWDANTESDLAGYKIYWGLKSGNYSNVIDTKTDASGRPSDCPTYDPFNAKCCEYTITAIPPWIKVFYAATAYDTEGNESAFSEEINHVAIPNPKNLHKK